MLLFWGLLLAGNTADVLLPEPDITGLPYTAPMSLVEGTDLDDWEFEVKHYARKSTPLATARSASGFCGPQGQHVRNAAYRLRFEPLAEALYRERASEFRKAYPETAETAIRNSAFDEAVLLTAGAEQLFLARSGTVVYALWVDFPMDLSGSIEAAADVLAE